jgi:hypothetical protein
MKYIFIYVCIHTHIYTYIHTYIYICVYTHIYMHIYVYIYIYTQYIYVGPYLVVLVCISPFIYYLFGVYAIFWFLYFDLFQVKVQLVSKWKMDYIIICFCIVDFNIDMKLDLVVLCCRLLL